MSYELEISVPVEKDDTPLWWTCGWEFTGLHRALAGLSVGTFDSPDEDEGEGLRIPVDHLAFLTKVRESAHSDETFDLICRIASVDCEDAYKAFLDLPALHRGKIKLLHYPEGLSEEEKGVCDEIISLLKRGAFGVTEGIAKAYETAVAAGYEEVVLYAG